MSNLEKKAKKSKLNTDRPVNAEKLIDKPVQCKECGSTRQGKEKTYQDFKDKETGEIVEVHTGNLIYCKDCVDKSMKLYKHWDKLAKELKFPDLVYWQLKYIRPSGDFRLGIDTDETWMSWTLSNEEALPYLERGKEQELQDYITSQLKEMISHYKNKHGSKGTNKRRK